MNKQTKFQIKLIAKKNALESMIEDAVSHINDDRYPSTKEFFVTQKIKYEAQLDIVNQIINDYLNN
tara:strand:- start:1035 stop:1232 length:198 start_codon:yes stop_codon:yes gene_type:complete